MNVCVRMMRFNRKAFFSTIFVCVLLLLYYQFNLSEQIVTERITANASKGLQSVKNGTKYVLFWTRGFHGKAINFIGEGYDVFKHCKVQNCFTTYDKTLLPSPADYDAIIFHVPIERGRIPEPIPTERSHHQRYIFYNRESPVHFLEDRAQYLINNFYNWTMTYRKDSDIPRTYGHILRIPTPNFVMPKKSFVKKKPKMVAWLVSNCRSKNKREEVARVLSKYVSVDIYGRCGNLTCPKTADCFGMIERNYKFYLAFENSHCNDYVTEKLYSLLKYNIIPVVYGAVNYREKAPPHSVINVEGFDSIKSLADYLIELSNDPQKYLEYFEWKKHYQSFLYDASTDCNLCKMLNNAKLPPKTYPDIVRWFWGTNYSECRSFDRITIS